MNMFNDSRVYSMCAKPTCKNYMKTVAGCSEEDCGVLYPKCPVCKYFIVVEDGLVCDSCYGVECSNCLKHKEYLERIEFLDGTIKFICPEFLSSPVVYSKYKKAKVADSTKFQFKKREPTQARCLGCGEYLEKGTPASFCEWCLEHIKDGVCIECGEPTTEIDETGRCASCQYTATGTKYLTAPKFPPCACGIYEAPYAGAVCAIPNCIEKHNAKLCPICTNRYIKPGELMCTMCLKKHN